MNVLVLLSLSDAQKNRLEAAVPKAAFTYAMDDVGIPGNAGLSLGESVTDEQVAAADVIVGNIPAPRLNAARNLKLLQLNSAGYDNYLAAGTLPQNTMLANATGAYGQAVSEHMLAMVLAMMKHLTAYRDDQRAHVWLDHGPVTSMANAHVLVLGAGDIGTHFARLSTALGAHVTGLRRHVKAGSRPEGFAAVEPIDRLFDLLPQADVVASFLPSTGATRHLAKSEFFEVMKPGAYFANGGRGDLVDQDALAAALESGHLAGAALDVTSPEPLPADSPLWDAPNIFITPHVSGGFHLPTVLDNVVDIAAENLRHLQAGEPIRNEVAH